MKKAIRWTLLVIVSLFVLLVLARIPFVTRNENTAEAVARIHATKLQMADVTGERLPPEPSPALKDATIEGVDVNYNGIRDDVELAIFKEYPNSAKHRAVLLQYALVLQMQMTLPIVNKETVTATVEDNVSRALTCIWSLSSRDDMDKFERETDEKENFTKDRQLNTEQRKNYLHNLFEGNIMSYSVSHGSCDIDVSSLPN